MGSLVSDLSLAARRLVKAPGFSLTIVALLALGIGAATAFFSVIDGVVLRPLPYPQPERLVFLQETSTGLPEMSVSYPNFLDWKSESRSFETLAVYQHRNFNLTGRGLPERVLGVAASAELFPALGARPLLGRAYSSAEDRPGAELVVGQGLRLVGMGLLAGLGLSLALSSLVASLLVGISAFDPLTFAAAALLLVAVALAASLLPTRRASRVDPMAALRS